MDIRIDNDTARALPRRRIVSRLSGTLARVEGEPVTAHVSFADLNGPKGGVDIRCAVRVDLPGQLPLLAESVATTPRLAFDESYARLVRRLERGFARWQESRRRPKKYFVAKQLLCNE
jgi:hypothetical protein